MNWQVFGGLWMMLFMLCTILFGGKARTVVTRGPRSPVFWRALGVVVGIIGIVMVVTGIGH